MKTIMSMVVTALFASFMFTGCVIAPGQPDYRGVEIAPPLPAIVELDAEPYYYQGGYHYFYQNDRWRYSKERNGPWTELPRSHWPKEIRHRERDERGGESRHEHEGDRH
jgi:hypothetical protein